MENPHEFASEAVRIVKDRLADHLVEGIKYEPVNEWYEMTQLEVDIESWEQYLVASAHSVYSSVVCRVRDRASIRRRARAPR